MPFAATIRPAIGISLLKAALNRDGLPCDIRYFNFDYAKQIGVEHYEHICTLTGDTMLAEYIFALDLFGEDALQTEEYVTEVLNPVVRSNAATTVEPNESAEDLLSWVHLLAEHGRRFLDNCMASIRWEEYSLVGFTSTFHQSLASLALAKRIKSEYPHVTIAFGGANCEEDMGAALHRLFPFIDYVCSGEGDINVPVLAKRILYGEPCEELPGIIRRVEGQTILPKISGAPVEEMDALPIPDYDDFAVQRAEVLSLKNPPHILIETARGCWWGQKHHCTFCGLNGATMKFRAKSPDRALSEISTLVERYDTREIAAVDNIIAMQYFQDLLPRLASLDLEVEFFYETKSNLRKTQVRQLREAGVVRIQPGIESLNTNILRIMRKGVTALQNIQLLRWCAEYMVEVNWNILAGFPGEMPEDYARQTEILPLLVHLAPPTECAALRLDRFSPLFVRPKENGLQNLRPRRAYKYIYPFAEADLFDLAYYFDFDYSDGRIPISYLKDLTQRYREWNAMHSESYLVSLACGDTMMIWDTRPVAIQREHRLTGLHRQVYEYCDHARTHSALETYLKSLNGAKSAGHLDEVLSDLINAKLLLTEDNQWISLGVSGEYQVEFLVRHLASGKPVPGNTTSALKRLYETQPDIVRSVVEDRLQRVA
jgi:ribosomal peptide maturation radical SAM protein 1